METYAQTIVRLALAYVNANLQEIQPNQGWTNKPYEADMRAIGWLPGDEWCADSATLVWKKTYQLRPDIWAIARRMLSANSQLTANNFHAHPWWPTGLVPKPGAIVVWQNGDSLTEGHEGIVTSVDPDKIHYNSAEGNTSSTTQPDIRTGWTYAQHTHTLGLPHKDLGLNVLRFVYPIEQISPLTY